MLNAPVRRAAVAFLLLISTACTAKPPAGPSSNSVPDPVRAVFPAVVKPARIFVFDRGLLSHVQVFTLGSRFVLYDDGGFALQYSDFPAGYEYRGRYQEADGNIAFEWEGLNRGAIGSLTANSLTVRYNFIMQMSDFEDAVYRRIEP